VPARELVPGDAVVLGRDRPPTSGPLAVNLAIDEAALTASRWPWTR
jgi:hypothetical protein